MAPSSLPLAQLQTRRGHSIAPNAFQNVVPPLRYAEPSSTFSGTGAHPDESLFHLNAHWPYYTESSNLPTFPSRAPALEQGIAHFGNEPPATATNQQLDEPFASAFFGGFAPWFSPPHDAPGQVIHSQTHQSDSRPGPSTTFRHGDIYAPGTRPIHSESQQISSLTPTRTTYESQQHSFAASTSSDPHDLPHEIERLPATSDLMLDQYIGRLPAGKIHKWKCMHPECEVEKSWRNKEDARTHVRQHLGETMLYWCTGCKTTFVSMKNASRHQHNQGRKHPCDKCGGVFTRIDYRNKHMKTCRGTR